MRSAKYRKQKRKPNYNSVMNYNYQKSGVDNNCTLPGNGVLAYSHGTRPSLDENALVEADGICGVANDSVATDWNDDGDFEDTDLAMNIDGRWQERDDSTLCQDTGTSCFLVVEKIYNEAWTVLTDHNDWGALVFTGISDSDELNIMSEVIVEDDVEDIITPAGEHSDPIDPLAPTQIPTRGPGG